MKNDLGIIALLFLITRENSLGKGFVPAVMPRSSSFCQHSRYTYITVCMISEIFTGTPAVCSPAA